MTRKLYLDWDNGKLTILALGGRRGFSEIQFLCIDTEGSPNPVMAEEQGEQLRSFLKELAPPGCKTAVCLGRDRLIARQLTIPKADPAEEPALVRFQVLRELNESPDEIRLDYLPFDPPGGSDRRVLALMVRVELFNAWKTILQEAQTKLVSLCPRLSGLGGLIADLGPAKAPVALLAIGSNWAELGVFIDGLNIFSRSLNPNANLSQEVKRSLALFAAQNENLAPKSLFILAPPLWKGDADLAAATNLPLQRIQPFDGILGTRPLADREGEFTASLGVLIGLARLEEKGKKPSPDFANPRQPPPPSQLGKQRAMLYAAVGAAVFLVVGYFLFGVKNATYNEMKDLEAKKEDLKKQLELAKNESKRVQALAEWDDVVWLDEMYDLAQRVRNSKDLQWTEFEGKPRQNRDKDSEFRSQLKLKVNLPGGADKREGYNAFVEEIRKDEGKIYKTEKQTTDKGGDSVTLEIDVRRRRPDEYKRTIKPPVKEKAKEAEPAGTPVKINEIPESEGGQP